LIGRYHSIFSGTEKRRFGSEAEALGLIAFFWRVALRRFLTVLPLFMSEEYPYITMLTRLPTQKFESEHSTHTLRWNSSRLQVEVLAL
jgi:hypothetical protein